MLGYYIVTIFSLYHIVNSIFNALEEHYAFLLFLLILFIIILSAIFGLIYYIIKISNKIGVEILFISLLFISIAVYTNMDSVFGGMDDLYCMVLFIILPIFLIWGELSYIINMSNRYKNYKQNVLIIFIMVFLIILVTSPFHTPYFGFDDFVCSCFFSLLFIFPLLFILKKVYKKENGNEPLKIVCPRCKNSNKIWISIRPISIRCCYCWKKIELNIMKDDKIASEIQSNQLELLNQVKYTKSEIEGNEIFMKKEVEPYLKFKKRIKHMSPKERKVEITKRKIEIKKNKL